MSTINHKIQMLNAEKTGYDVYHTETNTGQVYDFKKSKWLDDVIAEIENELQNLRDFAIEVSDTSEIVANIGIIENDITTIEGLISAIQSELAKKYVKPSTGIAFEDLSEIVKNALLKTDKIEAIETLLNSSNQEFNSKIASIEGTIANMNTDTDLEIGDIREDIESISISLQDITSSANVHMSNKNNPHGVTKSQVGLGSVLNYGIATQAESELGTIDTKYMTPLKTKQSVQKFAKPIADTAEANAKTYADSLTGSKIVDNRSVSSNPKSYDANRTTQEFKLSEVVGLGGIAGTYVHLFTERAWANDSGGYVRQLAYDGLTTRMWTRFGNQSNNSWGEWVELITKDLLDSSINLHANNKNNPHGVTKGQVGLSNVDNAKQATKSEFDTHVNDTEKHITNAERTSWNSKSNLALGETSSTAYRGDRGKIAYDHSQTAHAPSNAQKNSDITKAEIEAKLTGDISSHTHDLLSVKPDNYKSGIDKPSTYDRGVTVFFTNNPTNKFNGKQFGTIHTIKSYSNMAVVQFIYPYNDDDPIYYRYGLYNTNEWLEWREIETTVSSQAKADKALEEAKTYAKDYADNKAKVGGKFEWQYNAITNSLDLVVIE